jgi:3-methyl-2-indolic acid synthase
MGHLTAPGGIDVRAILTEGVGDIEPAAAALALLNEPAVSTEELVAAARRVASARSPQLSVSAPLYLTNCCDSLCKMCGMRRSNAALVRRFSGKKTIEQQLHVLYDEGFRAVIFLTGEYLDAHARLANAFLVGWALRTALDMGFEHVHFNIGSLVEPEIAILSDWASPGEPVTMALFQETFVPKTYARFMGADAGASPKADFERRIRSFDRWLDAGFTHVNTGVLLGLHRDLGEELSYLLRYVARLVRRGAVVGISLPRLRPVRGFRDASGIDDDTYLRVLAIVALVCPEQRLALTTREDEAFQARAMDVCGIFSPGSCDVAPYRRGGEPANDEASSQFLIPDHRNPGRILAALASQGRTLGEFAPASAPPRAGGGPPLT